MVSTLGRTAGALMLAGGAVLSHSAGAVVVTLPKYNVNVAEVSV